MTGQRAVGSTPRLKKKLSGVKFDTPNQSQLGYYLAGLIEGDGSIIVPRSLRNDAGVLLYPVIKITSSKKDKPLLEKLVQILNGGNNRGI